MGLYHTYQLGCIPPGDEVDDTPYESDDNVPHQFCFPRNTCPQPGDDPIHNFMSFTMDDCMNHFTPGQATRMNAMMSLYRPTMLRPRHDIIIDQRLSTNQQVGVLKKWEGSYWSNNFDPGIGFYFPNGSTQTFLGDQTIISNQKYNRWTRNSENVPNVINHHSFTILPDDNNFTSRFEPTYSGITIKTSLEGTSATGGVIGFRDPWFIDYPDPAFGDQLRNRGMDSALFYSRPSPFNPDYSTPYDGRTYKGVFLNQDYRVPGQPYYSVGAISPQAVTINGRTHNFYFQNWSASPIGSAEFQNANAIETGVVFKNANAVVQANMKGSMLSNDPNAFNNNSQRKFITAQNGDRFIVYESLNSIWLNIYFNSFQEEYEIKLASNAKNPSIDFFENTLSIVYESWENGQLKLGFTQIDANNVLNRKDTTFVIGTNQNDYGTLKPVVSCASDIQVIIYKPSSTSNLKYRQRYINSAGNWVWSSELNVPNTNQNTLNWSIARERNGGYFIAFQQGLLDIFCMFAQRQGYDHLRFYTAKNVSKGSGFKKNIKPSIIERDGFAYICWIGEREPMSHSYYHSIDGEKQVVFINQVPPNRFWTFGVNVNSVSINKINNAYAIAWASDNNTPIKYTHTNRFGDIYSLGIIGKDVQLCNGTTPETMHALAFNTSSLPYFMQTERVYFDAQPIPIYFDKSREGIVSEEDAQIYYKLGSIKVDGEEKSFVDIPDTISITNQQTANQYLVSEPFMLTNNSEFFYSVQYGLTDSLLALAMLNGNKQITFKVELIDAITNEVIGVFDEVTYDQSNLTPYEKLDYQVLTQGIGERLVRMRLVIGSNFIPDYSVADKYEEPTGLAKKNYKQIHFNENLAVKEYSLSQNYPNPFNPTTTINYQIKEDGLVTLKLYDILGSEVRTLVNEEKTKGRYSYNFDGSDLASGVYIYQLRVNDFVSTKKLMLMK